MNLLLGQYNFNHYTDDKGLPSNSVSSLLKDKDGFIWVATQKGICRFDGHDFLLFDTESNEFPDLNQSDEFHLFQDKEGIVWIATKDQGLYAFDQRKKSFRHFKHDELDQKSLSDDFVNFVNSVSVALLNAENIETEEQLLAMPLEGGVTVDEMRRGLISKLGENITVRRFEKFKTTEGGTAAYLHGNKIGVIVELAMADQELGKDVAMHIAASKPVCVSEDQVPAETIEKEKEIFLAQQEDKIKGKPVDIVEKMIAGRVSKFLGEVTLLGQPFIKDDKKTVGQLAKEKGNIIIRFSRFEVGEGIEKKEENFAEEVMAQVRGN